MLRDIGKCTICCIIQLVFSITQLKDGQLARMNVDSWKIIKDDKCKNTLLIYLERAILIKIK